MMGLILVAQAAAQGAGAPLPDVEIHAHVEARSVDIRQQGHATMQVHADPGEAPPVEVERSAPPGARSYRNLKIDLHAIARLTAPEPIAAIQSETATGDPE